MHCKRARLKSAGALPTGANTRPTGNRSAIAILCGYLACGVTAALGADISEHTSVGGYGEVHLNYLIPETGRAQAPTLDFHRFVLFVGHQWTDEWSLASEIEIEHNFVEGGKEAGEIALEQAYIQYNPRPEVIVQAGVVLPATGLINDKHEPTLFLSVERPRYNRFIIPTTWFGNGAALRGLLANAVNYSLVVMEGLDDRDFDPDDGIRSGRQEGFEASLETALFNMALDYTAVPGLDAGCSFTLNRLITDPSNSHPYRSTMLWEAHTQYKSRGIWAQMEIGAIGFYKNNGHAPLQKTAQGYYLDAAYDLARLWNAKSAQLYPFARFGQYNSSGSLGADGTNTECLFGFSLLPIPKVSVKAEYGLQGIRGESERSQIFNAGAGYAF